MMKIIYKEKKQTGKDAEVAPSTTTDIKRLDKKLEMSLQKEGAKP